MKRAVAATVLASLLGGCAGGLTPEPSRFQAAAEQPQSPGFPPTPAVVIALKDAAGRTLKDPVSAQWGKMIQAQRLNAKGERVDVVCGTVNAKNSYGGYVGMHPFIYFVGSPDFVVMGNDATEQTVFRSMFGRFCEGLAL